MEFPPIEPNLLIEGARTFAPAYGVAEWVDDAFLSPISPLYNREHEEIRDARILYVWASYSAAKQGMIVAGQAELNQGQTKTWFQGRMTWLFGQWFEQKDADGLELDPDFVITLSAPWFENADAVSRCAVVEHELFHCRAKRDNYGEIQFDTSDDRPKWEIKGHDVEEHIGVVRRYGAWSHGLRQMRDALNAEPLIGRPTCEAACGCCGARIG
jgi:Putative phage metallopeptidase